MANVTVVRTATSSQIGSLLTQASASVTYAPIVPTTQTGFRNRIINGGFDIWQRGTSAFTAAGYTADRWVIQNASGQTISVTQQAFTPGNAISGQEPTNFLRISLSGTPSGTYWLTQKVEDVRTFAGQTVTLSFWAKAGSATTALLPALEQNFGSGGSSVVTTTGSALSLTTSWQRFSQTFSVPSISGKTIGTNSFLEVRPFLGSTAITGNNIDIWGVQLEAGSTATPFEQRFIGTELALCQRYYETSNGLHQVTGGSTGFGGNTYFSWTPYNVEKRISLSLVTNNTSNGVRIYDSLGVADQITMWKAASGTNSINESFEVATTKGFGLVTSGGGTTDAGLGRFYWYANAEL